MLVNEQYIAPQILRLSQGTGIKLFIVNSALTQDQRDLISQSRHKYLTGSAACWATMKKLAT